MKTINTFINGFDKIIQKGIPVGSVVLIAGITGSMKSAISSYILYKNALEDRKSIFVSLQHSETEIIEQMKNFGWNYDDVKGDMYILDYKKIESATALPYKKLFKEELVDTLLLMKQTYNYELVVIDCLTALDIISEFKNPRIEFFKFFEWLKKLDTTSFLVSEMLQPKFNKRFFNAFTSSGDRSFRGAKCRFMLFIL